MGSFSRDGSIQDGARVGAFASPAPSHGHSTSAPPANIAYRDGRFDHGLRVDTLVRAIEYEILPRLMRAHRESQDFSLPSPVGGPHVRQEEIDTFTAMVIEPAEGVVQTQIDYMRRRGVTVEDIYLELLTPVARRLGELWEQDVCSFSDVTIGLGRLQQVLRSLGHSSIERAGWRAKGFSILLLPCPGEQHSFGLAMVGEFFRWAGWQVKGGVSPIDAVAMVSREKFDVIGLSMGAEVFRAEMAKCIREVRGASMNPGLLVLVGGPAFLANPGLVSEVRADAMAADGREAPQIVESLLAERRALNSQGAKV